jgi:hypothetical protein
MNTRFPQHFLLVLGFAIPSMIFLYACNASTSRSEEAGGSDKQMHPNILWIVGENLNLDLGIFP